MSFSRREAAVVILLACAVLIGGIMKYWRDYSTPVTILMPADRSLAPESGGEDEAANREAFLPSAVQSREASDSERPLPAGAKIDVNRASWEDLMRLPGIGPILAQRIIEYRRQNGPFMTEEDLLNVSGIGSNRYDAVREFIVVD